MTKRSVLFVCLAICTIGNICRSPMAEAIFIDLLKSTNRLDEWIVDSAAIVDIQRGKTPYILALKALEAHGITGYTHRARQASSGDFSKFDYIFGLDEENVRDLRSIEKFAAADKKAKVELLGSYDPNGQRNVIDPYYIDTPDAFEITYHHVYRCCRAFLDHVYKTA